jgi:hypothetical protein
MTKEKIKRGELLPAGVHSSVLTVNTGIIAT